MSRFIDLMPQSARARAARKVATRRWIVAYTAAIAIGAFAVAGARLRTAALHREVRLAERQVQLTSEEMTAVSEIVNELGVIADSIELQRRIVPTPTPETLLASVARLVPESMTLTSLLIDQRQSSTSASVRAARRSGEPDPNPTATVQISGVTPDDTGIVRLIQALDRSPVFAETSLEYSRPVLIRGVEAREFRVTVVAPLFKPPAVASAGGTP
ncbi:MAG: PilN domain-containing protein [Phycisphaerales bacterium]